MADIQKFNRGDVAEAILGATLVAKFNQMARLKGKNAALGYQEVDAVLTDFFTKGTFVDYSINDIAASKGKKIIDKVRFYVSVPAPARKLLENTSSRDVVRDLYDSAISYVEDTWVTEIVGLIGNNEVDDIAILSDGVGDQKGTKADIKINVNGQPFKRQISLKVSGGEQFAQISGDEFSKQVKLWEDILHLDIRSLEKAYNESMKFDTKEVFSSREDERLQGLKTMIKGAVRGVYGAAADQMKELINRNDKKFFENISMLVYKGATLGDSSIELVKLENRKYKNLKFSDENFLKIYSARLKNANLQIKFTQTGDPKVEMFAGAPGPTNLILRIRAKVEAASRTTKAGKTYSPYLRNLVEAGPRMFSLL